MSFVPRAQLAAAFPLLLVAACAAPPPPPAVVPPPTAAPPAAVEPPPRQSARRTDPRWVLAASEDPLEKARLAIAVGAAELLEGVADGGETAEIALGSLPFADDADIALGRLSDLVRAPNAPADAGAGGPRPARRLLLESILGIAGKPRGQREALDPEGARRCGEALLGVARDASLPREERALALSAARALAEKGFLARALIPGDLDPAVPSRP